MLTRLVLGLTLGGGGARGGAHIGVLRVLEEIGYQPDVITGTSIGGIIAALVAAGWSADRIEELLYVIPFNYILTLDRSGKGLIGNEALREELCRHFGDADLRDLPIRVGLIAADVTSSEMILIDHGPVVDAVMATMAVPGLFPPVEWNGRVLVDGGIVSNVPTRAAYLLGAQRLVAVDVAGHLDLGVALDDLGTFSKRLQRILYWVLNLSRRQTAFDVLIQSNILSYRTLTQYELATYPPDVLIKPDLPHIGLIAMEHMSRTIPPGEEAARKAAPDIRRLMSRRRRPKVRAPKLPSLTVLESAGGED